jgi:hypothetical protein
MTSDTLPGLLAARQWLLAEHAAADAKRNHGRLRWIRSALGAVEAAIAVLSETPQPVRAHRAERLRKPVPPTVAMDLRPTCYGPPACAARTELMTELAP